MLRCRAFEDLTTQRTAGVAERIISTEVAIATGRGKFTARLPRPMVGEPRNPVLKALYRPARRVFGMRTLTLAWFDLLRLRARTRHPFRRHPAPTSPRLHVGCGDRRVQGWLNVDVAGSEYDVDLGAGRLPWESDSFDALVSQHVIEHLELFSELNPLLREFQRILRPEGSIWLSCPDMEKVCRAYAEQRLPELLEDRLTRDDYSLQGAPVSQLVNDLFHQYGEHKNLYDFELLRWALESNGFVEARQIVEADLREAFPEFPERRDDNQTLYVTAKAG
jgi:predicted SAM-dependent methyltransferase